MALASVCRVKATRRFTVRASLPQPLAGLGTLAMNLRWAWSPATQDLFSAIDPELWQRTGQDPVRLLGEVSGQRLADLAQDAGFTRWVDDQVDDLQTYLQGPRWSPTPAAVAGIAYFSPEYGIAAAMPQYSGGLGILAGDHLKAASDLGVPIIGIGLYYRAGYFRQSLSREGWQLESYPLCDPANSPVTLLREPDGSTAHIALDLPGPSRLLARIWLAEVGRVTLLLLDTDLDENEPAERQVTDRLYGGGEEHRLQQELLLGVGGVRALRTFCRITGTPEPEVYHTNEGHAGFQGVERIRELVTAATATPLTFSEALQVVRASTVFTTHTPVPAGIDRFPRDLVLQYISAVGSDGGWSAPGGSSTTPTEAILQLGTETFPGGDPGVFNMAVMGLRLAQRANGVSQLHGDVSRNMFGGLWPSFDAAEVPIIAITNGVHAPTWAARPLQVTAAEQGTHVDDPNAWPRLADLSDGRLWQMRSELRAALVAQARQRQRASWLSRGASERELAWIDSLLDPDVLTIGFARRVPSYKRLTLMLRDPQALRDLLLDTAHPVQLVIAGKAHPADDGGKALIQQLIAFADEQDVRHRIAFLPDYDMAIAADLVAGCDVWLNNPIRPLEASGTSGMKAALNGALNLSILDGWWDEWFDGQNGWAIPSADGVEDPERRDDLEAAALYECIRTQVAPAFYQRSDGLPRQWLSMMRHTLGTLGPKVLASRMVREYVERLYLPAATASQVMRADDFAAARTVSAWSTTIRTQWPMVRVEHLEVDGIDDVTQQGSTAAIRAYVHLADLQPADVHVEALIGRVDDADELIEPQILTMEPVESLDGNRWLYRCSAVLGRTGAIGSTVRVRPTHEHLAHPAELGLQATG
jgi:starch phosphorylase